MGLVKKVNARLNERLRIPIETIDYIAFDVYGVLYSLLTNSGCGVWEPNLDTFTDRDKA